MKLYGYWRSSAVYRVRIALHHKGIPFEVVPINLLAGEQLDARYRDVNPQGLVPTLVDGDRLFHQSLAIIPRRRSCPRRLTNGRGCGRSRT